MQIRLRHNAVLLLLFLCLSISTKAQPSLFFSDLTSAPNTGNTDTTFSATGNGAYVTLYGNNFGASQGSSTITWNGQSCLSVLPARGTYTGWGSQHLWYQKIIIQILSTCTPGSGNFVVTTSSGTSNGLPFTVRTLGTNKIYYSATGGNDANAGTFQAPFANGYHCMGSGDTSSVERAGDTCYVENGDNITGTHGFASLTPNAFIGTPTLPLSLIVYPGATVTIGANAQDKGIENCYQFVPQCSTAQDQYLILAGFHVRGASYGVSVQGANNRFVAMEVQCPGSPNGDNLGCFNTINNFETVLGNEVSNTGMDLAPGGTCGKLCHSMYIGYTGAGQNFEIGWNSSHDVNGGRTYQFFNGSQAGFNINFHDNWGYNNVGVDGVTIDANPDAGYVNIYNNVIFNVCNNPDEAGSCTALYLQNTAGSPVAYEQVYNNTFGPGASHNNGTSYGMFAPNVHVEVRNNIFYATIAGEPCIANTGNAANMRGSNNVWFGCSGVPSQTTGNLTTQPTFNSLTGCANPRGSSAGAVGCNLAPASNTSPQVSSGIASWSGGAASFFDVNGLIRPSPPSIGAYEFTAGGATSPIVSLPTNLTFNPQAVGTISASQVVTLTNSGTGTLTITSVTLTGTNPSNFSIFSNNCGVSLAPSSSCQVLVTFNPTALASYSASLTFVTNAASSPNNVFLNGTGALSGFMLGNGIVSGSGIIKN